MIVDQEEAELLESVESCLHEIDSAFEKLIVALKFDDAGRGRKCNEGVVASLDLDRWFLEETLDVLKDLIEGV